MSAIRPQSSVFRAPGMAAARSEAPLLTCPCCGTPNFSERGLRAHCCRAKRSADQQNERLTPQEIQLAHTRANA